MNKKVILTILVLLFAAGSVVFLLWNKEQSNKTVTVTPVPTKTDQQTQISPIPVLPTPTSTLDISNWKTYTSKELGIEFKYPSHWSMESSYMPYGYIDFLSPELKPYKTDRYNANFFASDLTIEVYNSIEDIPEARSLPVDKPFKDLEEFYSYLKVHNKDLYGDTLVNGKFDLNGKYFYATHLRGDVNYVPTITFEHNNKIISFLFGQSSDLERNTIVVTLSFIK